MDIESNIAELSTKFIDRNLTRIEKFAQSQVEFLAAKIRTALPNTFKIFLERQGRHYGACKSFFIRQESTYLYVFYVPLGVTHNNKTITNPSLEDLLRLSNKILVTGLAGSGKSMFMRHLLLSSLAGGDRLPIFVELRDVSNSGMSIASLLKTIFSRNGMDYGDEFIFEVIKQDKLKLVLILDGFDELPKEKQTELSTNILQFDSNSPCSIVLSSRPEYSFSGWHAFSHVKLNPLKPDESETLIKKLPADYGIKNLFIRDLKAGLFDRHESFLANPLLLSIMLLTYGENASVPSKASLFYEQAFEALFHRHDALKAGYKRDRLTKLDVGEFARVFSAFCLFSYDDAKYIFTISEALGYIRSACDLTQIEVDAQEFLDDCLKAINLLLEDGLSITFTHRTFQEYFVARYIEQADAKTKEALLNRYKNETSIIQFIFEINPRTVEVGVFLPILNILFSLDGMNDEITNMTRNDISVFLRYLNAEMSIEEERMYFTFPNSTIFSINVIRLILKNLSGSSVNLFEIDLGNVTNLPKKGLYAGNKLTNSEKILEFLDKNTYLFSVAGIKNLLRIKKDIEKKEMERDNSLSKILGFFKERSDGQL